VRARPWQAALGLVWAAWAGWAVWTTPAVPFHPDEATHIYLSADFDRLVYGLDPAGVTWQAADALEDVRRYRLLEAPLSRYLIGLGRGLMGYAGQQLAVDWDWSASWAANATAGAVPDAGLLRAARLPAALLTVLAPLLLYDLGRRLTNDAGGAAAAGLLACSGAALLHGRRAMSEGPLLFCGLVAGWLAVRLMQHWAGSDEPHAGTARRLIAAPALLGAAMALAGAAKLTGWALLPVAAVAVVAPPRAGRWSWAVRLGVFLAAATLAAWALNPALWSAPVGGLRAMAAARAELLAEQSAAIRAAGAGHVLRGPVEHGLAELYHTYLAPLAYWDIPNYAAETAPDERAYEANRLNTGLRFGGAGPRLAAGGAFLALGLAGVVFAGVRFLRAGPSAAQREARWPMLLLAAWTAATVVGLFAFDIAWQRYYLPLLPLACLWAGYAVGELTGRWRTRVIRRS